MKIVIINGPNLNLLGRREPSIYGNRSMEQILVDTQRAHMDVELHYLQSNHEGDLIDWVQKYGMRDRCAEDRPLDLKIGTKCLKDCEQSSLEGNEIKGIVLNAGGYTHTSVALRDAVACCEVPVVEVHISDIHQREAFRRISLLTDVCTHSIIGHGTDGYQEAVEYILHRNKE